MGQTLSSSANNQDQDGDVIMGDDSENNIGDANGLDFGHNHTGATTYTSRRRTQGSRTSSQDRNQLTTSSTFEHAPQNGTQRVLRMTPARRRRQLSSLYPFFPSATTTNQTQIPLSRPLTRFQRMHHNTVIEDVSFAPRQTDAIAPNLLRRSRTRSSSYNGQETSASTGISFNSPESTLNTLPTSETMFDIRRPRSSSVDAIVNGDLDGDSTRPNVRLSDRLRRSSTHRGSSTRPYSSPIFSSTSSSNSSSSTAGTQTDSLAAQRSRRRVTRISARRLFNFGGQDSESNNNNNNHSNNNNEDNDMENHHLGRFLSIAAAATAASLVASQENAVIEAERAANEGHDGSFESFLAALQRRRREASNRSTNQSTVASSSSEEQDPSTDNNIPGSQPSQPMSFFRLFRFGGSRSSLTQQNTSPESGTDSTSSIPNVTNDTNSSNPNNTPHMVPVIIIGIRSVQPRDDPNGNSSSSQNDNSTNSENRNNSSRPSRTRSSSTSSRASAASARSTASTATQTPPARSWIIYVLGGTYPSTHPILTTPSLFSDNPTYEDMMLLSSLIGPARPPTTTQSEIDANLPIALYNEGIVTDYDLLGNTEKCQVCLCDYVANEEVRVLTCRHGFHKECIDKWLTEGSNKCPICRGVGVPPRESETNNSGPIPTTSEGLDSMGPFFQ